MTAGDYARRPRLGAALLLAAFAMGIALGLTLTGEIGMQVYAGATLLAFGLGTAGAIAGFVAHRREMAEIDAVDVELYERMDRIERAAAEALADGEGVRQ